MDELGTILRETRESRGLTIDEVARVTRIRPRYLEALEEGRYDVLPTPVHVRGFLRNYAIFLGVEPEPLIARYNASRRAVQDIPLEKQVRPEFGKVQAPPPEMLDADVEKEPVFYRPIGGSLHAPSWFSTDILIGAFVVIILLAFVGWAGARFVLPAISAARATETPLAETTVSPVATNGAVAVARTTQTATAPTVQPTVPPIFTSVKLELNIVERGTWLKVDVDGQVVQEGLTQLGDYFVWENAEQVKVLTGNGAGVDVTLNDQNLGRLGARGEVVEKIWGLSGEIQPTPGPTTLTPEPTTEPTAEPTEAPAAPEPTEASPTEAAPAETAVPTETVPEDTPTASPTSTGG